MLYLLKYERAKTERVSKDNSYISRKKIISDELLSTINPSLQIGHGYSLSDIRDKANEMLSETLDSFTNREIKFLLINHYKDNVKFTNPYEANKSMMVFLGNLSIEEIADKIRSIDIIKEAASKIINSLLDSNFNLGDRFSDVNDLQNSWKNMTVPEPLMNFLSVLFDIKKSPSIRTWRVVVINVMISVTIHTKITSNKRQNACKY